MRSIIDVPTTISECVGIKRAASPAHDNHPPSQHAFSYPFGQAHYYKRLRTSNLHPYLKTQNTPIASARAPLLAVWHDLRERDFEMVQGARKPNNAGLDPRDQMSQRLEKIGTSSKSAQESRPDIEPHRASEHYRPNGRCHNFFTKASVETTRGAIDLGRVQIDARSPFNLIPWSVVTHLDLNLYSGETLATEIVDLPVQTNHYSQFTIGIAGQNTMITAGVISGLQTILLGRDWIRRVQLLNDIENQNYFIPVPLAVEVTGERLPHIVEDVEARDFEHDENEFREVGCCDDDSPNCQTSPTDGSCSASEPAFHGQGLFNDDTPSDKLPLGDEILSDGCMSEITSEDENHDESEDGNEDADEDHNESENETDEEDKDETDEEDERESSNEDCQDGYVECEGWEDCNVYNDCGGCDECEVYNECEHDECGRCDECEVYNEREHDECGGCDGCEVYDECECGECEVCEEFESYDECEGCEECEGLEKCEIHEGEQDSDDKLQYTQLEPFVDPDAEQTEEAHRHQPEFECEPALPTSNQIFKQEQSTMPDEIRAHITKRQVREIANILHHIIRTPAGQSFKAPVEQLWPECAAAYNLKVYNPIDLGTIQVKVKNNRYSSVDDLRADVVLLYQNTVEFNGIDHIITSAALEVRDTILSSLSDMEEVKGSVMLRTSARIKGV